MKNIVSAVVLMTSLYPTTLLAQSGSANTTITETEDKSAASQLMKVQIDSIQIETAGLVQATGALSGNIAQLSISIDNLSKSNGSLSTTDREAIVEAAQSIDAASQAISQLASQLPVTASRINQDLINIIQNSQSQIADISSSIQSASSGVIAITKSYPEALENSKRLANEIITSGLNTLSVYTIAFFVLLTVTVAASVYLFYRIVLAPIITKLDELQTIPDQMVEISTQMSITSNNLLKFKRYQRGNKNRIVA